jgi:hypothetical protein
VLRKITDGKISDPFIHKFLNMYVTVTWPPLYLLHDFLKYYVIMFLKTLSHQRCCRRSVFYPLFVRTLLISPFTGYLWGGIKHWECKFMRKSEEVGTVRLNVYHLKLIYKTNRNRHQIPNVLFQTLKLNILEKECVTLLSVKIFTFVRNDCFQILEQILHWGILSFTFFQKGLRQFIL